MFICAWCGSLHPEPRVSRIRPILLEFYLWDHFLVVNGTFFWAHSSRVRNRGRVGGGDRSFDAVTLLLRCLLTFHYITPQNSSMSPVKCVLLTEPRTRQSISSVVTSAQPNVTCQLQRKLLYTAAGFLSACPCVSRNNTGSFQRWDNLFIM